VRDANAPLTARVAQVSNLPEAGPGFQPARGWPKFPTCEGGAGFQPARVAQVSNLRGCRRFPTCGRVAQVFNLREGAAGFQPAGGWRRFPTCGRVAQVFNLREGGAGFQPAGGWRRFSTCERVAQVSNLREGAAGFQPASGWRSFQPAPPSLPRHPGRRSSAPTVPRSAKNSISAARLSGGSRVALHSGRSDSARRRIRRLPADCASQEFTMMQ